jgi:hypothetical protein
MEEDVRQVMPQGVQAPDGVIKGMGYPGKRMPVGGVKGGKGPLKKIRIEGTDVGIICYVSIIIPHHKTVPEREEVYQESNAGD